MATEYKDNPPQFFKPTIPNNSTNVQGYYVTVVDGKTNIFRKSTDGSIKNIGSIPKKGSFSGTSDVSNAEKEYFTANASKTVTEQASAVVFRGVGGNAGGGYSKVNDELGTNLATTTPSVSNTAIEQASTEIKDLPSSSVSSVNNSLTSTDIVYPRKMNSDQDRIKFTLKQILGRKFDSSNNAGDFSFGSKNLVDLKGSVTLPIQPSISDSNGVEWGGSTLNPVQAFAARKSLSLAQSDDITKRAAEIFTEEAPKAFKANLGDYSNAISLYLAQEAVGAQGLLSRATGAIVNPNLELLFNGPTLRSFNFTFRLSPRSSDEAKDVKKIIYFFKAAMAVRRAASEVFLKAPYVFKIEYFSGSSNHKSLNRIKECALLGCDVDYTPDGSYMTFNDEERTMTSYQLTLRFGELDPIYNIDYAGLDKEIGF